MGEVVKLLLFGGVKNIDRNYRFGVEVNFEV